MQVEVEVNGRRCTVVLTRADGDRFVVRAGDREWIVDAARVNGELLSLLIQRNGTGIVESREIALSSDAVSGQTIVGMAAASVPVALATRRRWSRRDEGAQGASGPQRVIAPMPGKVVRIAAAPGTPVAARQPVVVIEAMKMENELRALRPGTVTEVLVKEGQSVEAGTLLAIVTPE